MFYITHINLKTLNHLSYKEHGYAYSMHWDALNIHTKSFKILYREQCRCYSTQVNKLNPWFVTGFTDAEGSFMASFSKSSESRFAFRVRAIFQIELHEKDLEILKSIQTFFGGIGYITTATKNCVAFRARSIEDLKIIIAHFEKFPLKTKKQADFELFSRVVNILSLKEHLKLQGFKEIVSIRASMNLGLTDSLKKAFPETIPAIRPIVMDKLGINPYWLVGFVSGEGCFFINLSASASNKIGYKVSLLFSITQHIRDRELLESIVNFLHCGAIKESSSRMNILTFKVHNFSDIVEKIIPFFIENKVLGVKSEDFYCWCKAVELMKQNKHLTSSGLDEIKLIKSGMNKGRPLNPETQTL